VEPYRDGQPPEVLAALLLSMETSFDWDSRPATYLDAFQKVSSVSITEGSQQGVQGGSGRGFWGFVSFFGGFLREHR
jgi:hypothetical protein